MQYLFRIATVIALIVGTYLATTDAAPGAVAAANDKFLHYAAFGVLAFLVDGSFGQPPSRFWPWVGLPVVAYGMLIEIVQHSLPYRSFDLADLLADAAGVATYWLFRPLIGRILGFTRATVS